MIKLDELLDVRLLTAMLADGYVRAQVHPSLPLTIYNYSEKAAYEGVWNEVTLACRGLIVETATGVVLARPLRKFFNWAQAGAPNLDLNEPAIVTDKLDGSMGVTYPTPNGLAIATRGSFASEQAVHATGTLRSRYPQWEPPSGLSVIFEIVYPGNRIVCDYGQLDDLVLLGAVDIKTGRTYGPDAVPSWHGPVTEVFGYRSLAEALAAPPRRNAEGLVVHLVDSDERVKLKQADYTELHKIVTGLNARTVWEHMLSGEPLAELIEPLPDEFHVWVQGIASGIESAVFVEEKRLRASYDETVTTMPDGWERISRAGRKDFAMVAAAHPDKWALFAQLDGKDIHGELLKRAKPEPYITPSGRIFTEDNA